MYGLLVVKALTIMVQTFTCMFSVCPCIIHVFRGTVNYVLLIHALYVTVLCCNNIECYSSKGDGTMASLVRAFVRGIVHKP